MVKFSPQLCVCDSFRVYVEHVDVQDSADRFVVEGFESHFIVSCEGLQLGAP